MSTVTGYQDAVYATEKKINRGEVIDRETLQAYVDGLTATEWWEDRYRHVVRIEVTSLDRDNEFHGLALGDHGNGGGVIGFRPDGDVTTHEVLHEAAHVITPGGHHAAWVRTLLEVTYLVRGSESYSELRAALVAEGVDVG